MLKQKAEKTFMVRCGSEMGPYDTGNRLVVGVQGLQSAVREFIPRLSDDSREIMRGLIEQDQETLEASFRGMACKQLYAESGSRRVDVYMITASYG